METCNEYEALVERMLADEIDDVERDRLLAHAERCRACREYVELHHRLLGSELDGDLPTDEELADVRGAVLERIRAQQSGAAGSLAQWLQQLWHRPAWAALAAASLLLALVGGVGIGRLGAGGRDGLDLRPAEDLYSNVSLRDAGNGTMSVGFDVTRHVEVRRSREDPLVRELLVQSVLGESDLGDRLAAMSQARSFAAPEVKQALIRTLLNDPEQVVRQRALETLAAHERDEEIESAMIAVLRTEPAVHVRLMALDLLAAGNPATDRVEQLVEDLERRQDRAVLVRAESYFPDVMRGDGTVRQ
jgi:hypothetical protein